MPSNLLTPFLELDDEFCKSFQGLDVQDSSRRALGFQRRHSLCPVTLPNSKFNTGGAEASADDLWGITGITKQPWSSEKLPRSALQRIPFRADRSISMIESALPPPPGLSLSPASPGALTPSPASPGALTPSPASPGALTPVSLTVPAVSARYKTELCRTYEESGACKYGTKCQFAHGADELRGLNRHPKYKTEPCRTFHTVGFCPYGARCHFIHNADELLQQQPRSSRDRPRLLRQSVSFAGFSSSSSCFSSSCSSSSRPAFQALMDPLGFSRAASVSPPPSCSPDLQSPQVFPEALKSSLGFSGDLSGLVGSGRVAALHRSSSADSLSDHDGYSSSSSSGSLSGCDSPEVESSRRLPIFSRLSISDD